MVKLIKCADSQQEYDLYEVSDGLMLRHYYTTEEIQILISTWDESVMVTNYKEAKDLAELLLVCSGNGKKEDYLPENNNLINSAPDLLNSLQNIMEVVKNLPEQIRRDYCTEFFMAEAAIRKATTGKING